MSTTNKTLDFEYLLDIIDEGVMVFDSNQNLLYINRPAMDSLGLSRDLTLQEVLNTILEYEWFNTDGIKPEPENHPIIRILHSHKGQSLVAGVKIAGSAKTTWIRFNLRCCSHNRRVVIAEDISSQTQTASSGVNSAFKLRETADSNIFFDFIHSGLCKVYPNQMSMEWNPVSSKILGVKKLPDSVNQLFDMIHLTKTPDSRQKVKRNLLWYIANNKPLRDVNITFGSGQKKKMLLLGIFPILHTDGSLKYTIISFKEIRRPKAVQNEPQKHHLVRGILDNLDVPIAVVSHPDMKYEIANRNKCLNLSKILGRTVEEKDIVGRHVKDVAPIIQEKGICDIALICGYTKESIILDNVEYPDHCGNSMFYKLILCPVFDDNQEVTHVASVGIDITEQVSIQNKMQELSDAKEEFLSVVSHELRTPINVILSAEKVINSMINRRDKESREKVSRWLNMIHQNGLRLLKLVNNVLDLSKIDAGYLKINRKNTDYIALIRRIYHSIAPFVEQKGLSISFSAQIDELTTAVDEEKLERVILNLISNAVKYNKDGGKIEICVYRDQHHVYTDIRDTGIGIPEDKLDIIFERFLQVNSSLSRPREGAGIGLSLSNSIAQLHKGSITVESGLNQGSLFTLKLPITTVGEEDTGELSPAALNPDTMNIEMSDILEIN